MILCISVVMSPFSLITLLVWILPFPLASLANGMSILFTFSRKLLLVGLIFCILFLFSIPFISTLNIIDIFLILFNLGVTFSPLHPS